MPAPSADLTTVALLTPPGEGGISVIHLSGPRSASILKNGVRYLFRGRNPHCGLQECGPKKVPDPIFLGAVVDARREMIDEVIVHATREAVEINCHGGVLVTRRIMDRLIELGAVEGPAQAKGSLDAVQREAWEALIGAPTAVAAAILLDQYHGALSRRIQETLALRRSKVAAALEDLLSTTRVGLRLTNLPRVVIAGRRNVGKSSLLNALLGRPRAIVHELPGTTRDYIDAPAEVEGLPVLLLDTAGIGEPEDATEGAGIERSFGQIERADLVVAVFDGSSLLTADDRALADIVRGRAVIPVINKSDLPQVLSEEDVVRLFDTSPAAVSALVGQRLDALRKRLAADLFGPLPPPGAPVVFTARQRDFLREARGALEDHPSMCQVCLSLMIQ